MIRTQIQLTESQLKDLRQVSSATGKSIAALIRQGVALYLSTHRRASREEQVQRALRAAGKFSSGAKDTSTDHDRYLAEAFRG
jgi:hypothetical protein